MTRILIVAALSAMVVPSAADPVDAGLRGVLKLYGAGGFARVEAYQSAVLIEGLPHALTADTTLLDGGSMTAVSHDGVRREATPVQVDRRLGIAWLDVGRRDGDERGLVPRLALGKEPHGIAVGEAVYVISNLFGVATGSERPSMQSGVVMGHSTAGRLQLETITGASPLPAGTPLLLIDAVCSNPGTAGGAVLDSEGRLIALVGAERRSAATGGWLNYAIPIGVILNNAAAEPPPSGAARPARRVRNPFGLVLSPPVAESIPPFVTHTLPGSAARTAGLRADDLLVMVGTRTVGTRDDALRELNLALRGGGVVTVEVLRGDRLLSLELTAAPNP